MFCALSPANQWGWNEIFANKATYLLELLVWSKSKDATKRVPRNKPKPFVPDFLKRPVEPSLINKDSELHTVDEVRSILDMPRG